MFVSGRFPLLVAVGAVPVVLLSAAGIDAWAATAGWLLLCTVLALVDTAAAPDPRRIRVERRLPGRVLLGEPTSVEVRLRNTGTRTP